MRISCLIAGGLALTACATAPDPVGNPDFTPVATTPSVKARHFADCIAQATAAERYGHAYDEVHVVVFTCDGDPARAFFDALGPWSATTGSEVAVDGRTIRSTTVVERDLFAVDYCERRGDAYRCAISLRTGAFAQP